MNQMGPFILYWLIERGMMEMQEISGVGGKGKDNLSIEY